MRNLILAALALAAFATQAAVGLTEVAGVQGDNAITVYYPTAAEAQTFRRGPFSLQLAQNAAPQRGNGRLVVVSHGSGGNPWVHADLARALVEEGFVVAMPAHRGDNYQDPGRPGPESWERRPHEVSRAIDAVAADARFAPLLTLDKVGMYGMSAGGHTALSLAGGRWSPASMARYCEAHLLEDFQSCVGLSTRLTGGFMDGFKTTLALWIIRARFASDTQWRTHTDARIAAVVAAVPYAADFDMTSFKSPRVPLGLVTAQADKWLIPKFHSERVLGACASCLRLAEVPQPGGHGAMLSPLPPGLSGLLGELLNDPPGFDRATLPAIDRKIAAFFREHLR